jgi:hypothetical protein
MMSKGLEAFNCYILSRLKPSDMVFLDVRNAIHQIRKDLKALEILKKEPFISANWYLEGTYEEYVNAIEVVKITKDEWNIVKEVLK